MRKLRTWRAYLIERFAANREEAIGYLQLSLEEYQVDRDTLVFLLSLRTFVESQGGVSKLAKKIGIAPEVLSEVLSSDTPPPLDMLGTILNALGCRFSIEPIARTASCLEPKSGEGTEVSPAVSAK